MVLIGIILGLIIVLVRGDVVRRKLKREIRRMRGSNCQIIKERYEAEEKYRRLALHARSNKVLHQNVYTLEDKLDRLVEFSRVYDEMFGKNKHRTISDYNDRMREDVLLFMVRTPEGISISLSYRPYGDHRNIIRVDGVQINAFKYPKSAVKYFNDTVNKESVSC